LNENYINRYKFTENSFSPSNQEKILLLAYSGFFNIYNNDDSNQKSVLFSKSEEETPISAFFDKMKHFLKDSHDKIFDDNQKNHLNNNLVEKFNQTYDEFGQIRKKEDFDIIKKIYYEHEIICHFSEKLLKIEMSEHHHESSFKVSNGKIMDIKTKPKNDGNFSLFFYNNNSIYEWREFTGELIKIKKNIRQDQMRDNIYNYLISNRKESENYYEDDITIFSEITNEPIEKFEKPTKNFCIALIFYILFLIFFLMVYPTNSYYAITKEIKDEFDVVSIAQKTKDLNIVTKKELEESFFEFIFDKLYSSINRNKINFITPDSKKIYELDKIVIDEKKYTDMNDENIFFINDDLLFSGMTINFKVNEFVKKISEVGNTYDNIPKSTLYYTNLDRNYLEKDLNNFKIKDSLLGKSFQYFLPGRLTNKKIEDLKKDIKDIFILEVGEFSYSPIFYSISRHTIYSYDYILDLNPYNTKGWVKFGYSNTIETSDFIAKILMGLLIFIIIVILCYLIFCSLNIFMNSLFDTINLRKNCLRLDELLDIFTYVICLISCILNSFEFYSSLGIKKLDFEISDLEEFLNLQKLIVKSESLKILNGFALFLMGIRIFRFLSVSFPSFGILYQTMEYAFSEIFAYFMLVILMLFGFGCLAHSSFGTYSIDFESLFSGFYSIYTFYIGIFSLRIITANNTDNTLGKIFVAFFEIIFQLVSSNLFVSVFLFNYKIVKKKFYKFNAIYTIILKEKFEEISMRIGNIITFDHPQLIEFEEKKKNTTKNLRSNDIENEIKPPKLSKITPWDRFTYYFKILKTSFENYNNPNDFEKKKNEYLDKAEADKFEKTISSFKSDNNQDFNRLVGTFFYVIYIIIFISIVNLQTRNYHISNVNKIISRIFPIEFPKKYRNFNETKNYVLDFLDEIYITNITNETNINNDTFINNITNNTNISNNTIINDITNNTKNNEIICKNIFNDFRFKKFVLINPTKFRLTFRLFSTVINNDSFTTRLFPINKKSLSKFNYQNYVCNTEGEYIEQFKVKNKLIDYIPPYLYNTADNCGGFVVNIYDYGLDCDSPSRRNIIKQFMEINNIYSTAVEFFLFSIYEDFAVHIQIDFKRKDETLITYSMKNDIIPINKFDSKFDLQRLILEIVFLIFSINYLYPIFRQIFSNINKYFILDFESDDKKDLFVKSNIINKFFRIDFKSFKEQNFGKTIYVISFTILKKIITLFSWIVKSTINYLYEDEYNILDFIYMIHILGYFIYYINIILITLNLNLSFSINKDYKLIDDNYMYLINLIYSYKSYYYIVGISGICIILRIFKYLKFSNTINSFLLVIYNVKGIFIFHIISIVVFNFGFSILGYALFSTNMQEFKTIFKSMIGVLSIMFGTTFDTNETNLIFKIYYFFITFFNLFVFVNIILCIFVDSFYVIKNEIKINFGEDYRDEIFKKIYLVVHEKLFFTIQATQFYYHDVKKYCESSLDYHREFEKQLAENKDQEKNKIKNENPDNIKKKTYYDVKNFLFLYLLFFSFIVN
jgi:hypothetical protein